MNETVVPKPDAVFPSLPVGQGISWLTRSKRMLFIVSPFLAIVIVLTAVAVASIDILAAGRAYVEGESLWSKNQKESVFHLLRYAETGADEELERFEHAIKSPLGFKQARLELEKPHPDFDVVYGGFIQGGTHPDDIPGVISLYQRFHDVSYMKNVLDIWRKGDEFIERLTKAAEQLRTVEHTHPAGLAERQAIAESIIEIDRELRPWQNKFSNTLGEATRWIKSTLLVVVVAVAGTLVPLGIVLTQRVVSRVDRAERELKELKLREEFAAKVAFHASHDALTGLLNRLEFENRLKVALLTAENQSRHHVVMYIDLDQFKIVNDTCGHAAGDRLLRQVGTLLKQQVREGDSIARLGGDEFGVLLENCPMQDAIRIAEELRQCIVQFRFVTEERSFTIGASIGVVQVADGLLSLTEVLGAADAACYVAKQKGRNRVQYYRPHDTEVSMRRGEMEWLGRLQRALDAKRFVLYRQEIFALAEDPRGSRHFELLVRMIDDNGSVIPPMAFIPAAERYGLMSYVDEWVVENSFAAIKEIKDLNGTYAINISGTSIADDRFLEFVRAQFKIHKIPPGTICFEITETAAIANFDKAARFFGEMKALGCLFSLDDFGAGMSSFGYLKHLPVDLIKIDGSFVKSVAHDEVDRATVQAINDVGHVMGKRTIAEFVNGTPGLAALREIGVDYVQGDWLSPAKPFMPKNAPAYQPTAAAAPRQFRIPKFSEDYTAIEN